MSLWGATVTSLVSATPLEADSYKKLPDLQLQQ